MEFEPNFSPENKKENDFDSESRSEHRFAEEMEKLSSEWSEEFKSFLNKKIEMKKMEAEQEELIEILKEATQKPEKEWSEEERRAYEKRKEFLERQKEESKETVAMYFDDLEITENEIVSKKIMDVGCGEEAPFVNHAMKKLNCEEVYGLDFNLKEEIRKKYPNNLYRGDFFEELPVINLDLIVSRAAITDYGPGDEERFIKNMLKHLNEEGELRMYPIFENHPESSHKEALKREKNRIETLNKLADEIGFEYSLKIKEILAYSREEGPIAKKLLRIKKDK